MEPDDIFKGYGIEVQLPDDQAFLKIKETLTRIGVASRKDKHLYQSCHILHKRQHYAIVHFKELFALDGKPTNFSDDDRARRNKIAALLEDWKLLIVKDKSKLEPSAPMSHIKVINFKEKNDWILMPKYAVGTKKRKEDV